MNDDNQVKLGNITIDGHEITKIEGPSGQERDVLRHPSKIEVRNGNGSTEIKGNGCLALPGLVNGHIHSYRNVFRYVPEKFGFPKRKNKAPNFGPRKLEEEHASDILRLSYLEGLKAGVTFCSDFPQWLREFRPSAPFEIAHKIGMKGCIRVVLSHDSYKRADRTYFTGPGAPNRADEVRFIRRDSKILKQIGDTVGAFENGCDNYQIGVWIPWETLFRKPEENKFNERTLSFLDRLFRDCAKEQWTKGVRLTALMHYAEHRSTASLEKFQWFVTQCPSVTQNLVLFHSIHIGQGDIDLMKHKIRTVTCPKFSDSRLAPVRKMLDSGISVGLGTDFGAWDLFPAIGLLPKLHRFFGKDGRDGGVDVAESLRMATTGGAKVYQVDDRTGSIREGNRADLVLIDRSELPLCLPLYTAGGIGQPVVDLFLNWDAVRGSDVHTVISDGKIVVSNHKLTRPGCEEGQIVKKGCEAIRKIHGLGLTQL
jgi:cytosine/adenosine deaminase-related metal-dependent hydrolase